jgi:hypothetical protein
MQSKSRGVVMNGQRNHTHGAVAGEDGGELDPREAAALLDQTTRRARRQLDLHPPFLMLVAAVVVVIAYGAIWLSVRNQHPYQGPSLAALGVLYGTIIAWGVFVAVVTRRAVSGVSGHSSQQRRGQAVAFAVAWIFVYVFQGALHHAGASHAIAYGIYPAAAPLIIVGSAAAAYEAAKENWEWSGFACGAVILAGLAAYTGPATVWAVVGVGLAVLLVARAASAIWLHG